MITRDQAAQALSRGWSKERWKQPCESMFEHLATHHPDQLVVLLRSSRMSPADLTFAAEIAGKISDSAMVRPALLPLLGHENPVVREGAIYGLANHLDAPTRERLRTLANEDASRAVRTAASDALDNLCRVCRWRNDNGT